MSNLEKAIKMATKYHENQEDKAGRPYIEHCLRVMEHLEPAGEQAQIVGVLHDILEDTFCGVEDLERAGFNDEVVHSVVTLTKTEEESYEEYIHRIVLSNSKVIYTKLADLKDNLDITRLPRPYTRKDVTRILKYRKAEFTLKSVSWHLLKLKEFRKFTRISQSQIDNLILSL